ncbi:UDP-N-acetylmuramoyl-tripeptide--D-alanyl-D-alanine ligase [Streptococcus suis]|uniref:UDP-N-acetylmuramoyl-tripeptide--D-alanyl-D- alanine ligase n=1 Tax=Streptococcus suis TaxID=1307 RepID=UPI00211D9D6C|nr:UDP-N-acetylmuramoyl-tripeptide--D-alanyl-D-alanine ligase [Streptococcus suis]UUM57932.1 UDP-N-acetylmuramoyl-tripeptide--D-alanyl-D-alanine ligase [Streptococcus suis]
MKLTLHEVAQVVGAKNDVTNYPDTPLRQVEFDSRKIEAGDLFVPLKGTRDGHDFIPVAFENGCVATLSEVILDVPHILVDDCLAALQQLAAYYLEKTGVEVIAVTGSNGKTTTKDMIHDVLAMTYKTYKTQGNYNNEIGLPYTVLHMPDDTEKVVLEMGQDHLGDIHLLSEIAKPSLSVITLFGEAHLEFFGSREEIAKGKLQIADGMEPGSKLLIPADPIADKLLPSHVDLICFGEQADLQVTSLVESKDSLTFTVNFMDGDIFLPVTGKYNATNAMVASYVGKTLGVPDEAIKSALAGLNLTRNRTEWKKATNGADILSDVYNANPTAMRLILETFSSIPANQGGKKIAVLAEMKELGAQSVDLHNQMIMSLSPDVLDTVIFYGQDIEELSQLASQMFPLGKIYFFKKTAEENQFDDLVAQVKAVLGPNDQILLKGSNSMNLAKLVEELEK